VWWTGTGTGTGGRCSNQSPIQRNFHSMNQKKNYKPFVDPPPRSTVVLEREETEVSKTFFSFSDARNTTHGLQAASFGTQHYMLVYVYYLKCVWLLSGVRCWWRSWLRHCATSRKFAGSIPEGVTGIFSLIYSFRPQYGPGVDSASDRNNYQEYFLRGKGGRCLGLTIYRLHVPIVFKSESLNLLEPSGPVMGLVYLSFDCSQ